jgi:V-type H+-transporting ATPase subunit a
VYTGIIYNDLFSKAMDLFGSGYEFTFNDVTKLYVGAKDSTYLVGIDPVSTIKVHSLQGMALV